MRSAAVLAALALCALLPASAAGQSESSLRSQIERSRDRERVLSGAVSRLGALERSAGREVAVVQERLAAVEADLAGAEARLAITRQELGEGRRRLVRLKRRHAAGRTLLAEQLVADYKRDPPDLVSFVLGAHDFADLLERIAFADRVRTRNAEILHRVRTARTRTRHAAIALARLAAERRETAQAIATRRAALASMRDGLAARQAMLVSARAARVDALAGSRAGRASAQRTLDRLVAERARAARSAAAAAQQSSGGPWAIPWSVVQCESGGQNLPPNGAGASGYYQMLPETWEGLGGSTGHAYQAPKAEQDRLASALWAGGSGARNWVCSG